MQLKQIDLAQSVYTLSTQYPELIAILEEIGFRDITKPGMMATGRTIYDDTQRCCIEKARFGYHQTATI